MALITAAEIITLTQPRNIDEGNIVALEITVAERDYVKKMIGTTLYDAVVGDAVTYDTFIDDYIKPVLAYGVIGNIWHRLAVEVTDRGINGFTGEGINTPQLIDKENALFEIRQRLGSCIETMIEYADEQYSTLYEDQEYQSAEAVIIGGQLKRNNQL